MSAADRAASRWSKPTAGDSLVVREARAAIAAHLALEEELPAPSEAAAQLILEFGGEG